MDAFPTDRTVDNFVLRLRKLFELNPEEPHALRHPARARLPVPAEPVDDGEPHDPSPHGRGCPKGG